MVAQSVNLLYLRRSFDYTQSRHFLDLLHEILAILLSCQNDEVKSALFFLEIIAYLFADELKLSFDLLMFAEKLVNFGIDVGCLTAVNFVQTFEYLLVEPFLDLSCFFAFLRSPFKIFYLH